MWHEARRQEKKLKAIVIDYKKRAERRQTYYQKMRMDPHQLIRLYGQKCKLNIITEGSKIINNGDGQVMPWQLDPEATIDRFDVRAHLDYVPEEGVKLQSKSENDEKEERILSYERYRTLVQIEATGGSEESYLKQLCIEEENGKKQSVAAEKREMEKQKSSSRAKAKIGYTYEDSSVADKDSDDDSNDSGSESDVSDIDININVTELTEEQTTELNARATQYGVGYGQYCKQLLFERKEFEFVKKLEQEEEERSKMPGRRGKQLRRNLREKQKTSRGSPLSYAKLDSGDDDGSHSGSSSSRSRSRERVVERIEFITEFGGAADTEQQPDISKSETKLGNRSSRDRKSSSSSRRNRDDRSDSWHRSKSRSNSKRSRSPHSHRDRARSRSPRSKHSSGDKRRSDSSHNDRHRCDGDKSSDRGHSRDKKHGHDISRDRGDSRDRRDSRGHSSDKRKRGRSRSWSKELITKSELAEIRDRKSPPKPNEAPVEVFLEGASNVKGLQLQTVTKMLASAEKAKAPVDKSALSAKDKMKLRMQKMLNKQVKKDKKVERAKVEKKEEQREERAADIWEMTRRMREKDRDDDTSRNEFDQEMRASRISEARKLSSDKGHRDSDSNSHHEETDPRFETPTVDSPTRNTEVAAGCVQSNELFRHVDEADHVKTTPYFAVREFINDGSLTVGIGYMSADGKEKRVMIPPKKSRIIKQVIEVASGDNPPTSAYFAVYEDRRGHMTLRESIVVDLVRTILDVAAMHV